MQLISPELEHIGRTARYFENTEKSQPASEPVLQMAMFVIFPFSSPLLVVKLNHVEASVLARNDSLASKPMYPAPGAASGAHCSGIEESACAVICGRKRVKEKRIANNFLTLIFIFVHSLKINLDSHPGKFSLTGVALP